MASPAASEIEGVRVTHPDRVLFRDQGITKLDLIDYYRRVAGRLLPQLHDRPVTIVRCPRGSDAACFFQKHPGTSTPPQVPTFDLPEQSGTGRYLGVADLAGLVALVQIGALELHVMGCRHDRPDRPDRLVFDLDPGPGVEPAAVAETAILVRDALAELGLQSYALGSGGKGLHVVAPLQRRADFDSVHAFAAALAQRLVERQPKRLLAKASKAARRGRIFVDWLRNTRGATAICPYSPRARRGAPVATPLAWSEVAGSDGWPRWSVRDLPAKRIEHEPWPGYDGLRQSVSAAALRDVGL